MTDSLIDETMPEPADTLEPTGDTLEQPEPDKAGNEAAKYRRQLRTVEAERDTLTTRLATYQAREAQSLVGDAGTGIKLHDPADLWKDGATVADVLDDDGQIDPDLVAELAQKVVAEHPHWRKVNNFTPASIAGGTAPIRKAEPEDWSSVLSKTGPRA